MRHVEAEVVSNSRIDYRVTRMVAEKIMLASNSKFRHWPGSQDELAAKRNFYSVVNIILSRSRWATL